MILVERLVIPLRVPPLTVDHGSLLVVAVAYLPYEGMVCCNTNVLFMVCQQAVVPIG
jgi:hypothetical protein